MKGKKALVILLCITVLLGSCAPAEPTPDAAATQTAVAATAFSMALTSVPLNAPKTPTPAETPTPAPPTQVPAPQINYRWQVSIVDEDQVGVFPSLQLDANDVPHIAYLDENNDDLKYATLNTDGSWLVKSFASPNADGLFPSLAFDSGGNMMICRYVVSQKLISCMNWTGSTWAIIHFINEVSAADVSLAFDSQDRPVVVLFDTASSYVRYYVYDGSAWATKTLEQVTEEGKTFPLAIGPNDQPHIAYFDSKVGLKYVTVTNGNWGVLVVEPGVGLYPALALDPAGMPHIAYYDQNQKVLKHAYLGAQGFQIDVVDNQGNVGWYPSIVVGANNYIHISYYDVDKGTLKYAVGTSGGGWSSTASIDNEVNVGRWSSIDLDRAGNPRIAYYSYEITRLKYAAAVPQ